MLLENKEQNNFSMKIHLFYIDLFGRFEQKSLDDLVWRLFGLHHIYVVGICFNRSVGGLIIEK